MKMKMKSLAVACALAGASQAYALPPSTTPDVQMFMSGSSALQNAIGQVATDLFVAGTIDEFWDGTGTVPAGSSYRAYYGTAKTGTTPSGITMPASLAGKKVLIYNTAAGGSIKGVNPVALAQAVSRLDISTCVLSSPAIADSKTGIANVYTCPGVITTAVPDTGVSDVEPALLTGINLNVNPATVLTTPVYTATALTPAQLGNLVTAIGVGQVFGAAITTNTTPALQSLSKAQVTALMDGSVTDWNTIDPTVTAGSKSVIVCRRQQGSGSQATINAAFFGFPCSSSFVSPSTAKATTATLGSTTAVLGGKIVVVENNSSGLVAACLTYAQTGTPAGKALDVTNGSLVTAGAANSVVLPAGGYAIGVMGLDRPANTTPTATFPVGETYQFANINGSAATLANASTGVYDIIVENAFTRRAATTAGIPALDDTTTGTTAQKAARAAQLDLFNTFVSAAGNPLVLGSGLVKVPGVAALSENSYAAPAVFDTTNPVFKVGNFGNTCAPLQQLQ